MQALPVFILLASSVIWLKIVAGNDVAEKRLNDYISVILNHYKQDDPVGAPIVPIPEPFDLPSLSQSFGLATMTCNNVSMYGLSKFRMDFVHVDLVEMQVKANIKFEELDITGNYSLKSWLSRSSGNFSIHLINVTLEATTSLGVQEDGQLEAQEVYTEFYHDNVTMEFVGLGSFERSMLGSSGSFVLESSKPYMMREMNTKLREDINAQIKQIPRKFPRPVSPLDQLIGKARVYARLNYEPLKLDDFLFATTISKMQLSHTWLYGISNFRRTGDVNLEIRNKTVMFKFDIGAGNVNGSTQWELSIMNGKRAGAAAFSLDDLGVVITASQPMDTSKPPHMEDIHLSLGEIRIGFNGAGIFDPSVVAVANLLPNLLNQQIITCLELMLKTQLRKILAEVSLEQVILGNVDKLEDIRKSGLLANLLTQ